MNEQRLEQAADWIDRINELEDDEFQQLLVWLDTPQNKQAFERLAQVFSDPAIKYALNKHTTRTQQSVKVSSISDIATGVLDSPKLTQNRVTSIFTKFALAASIGCFSLLMYWVILPVQQLPTSVAHKKIDTSIQIINAKVGERVSKLLNDGSYLHLNADSQLSAQLLSNSRKVTLTKGQAFFDVAKDSTRPFIINSGQATIKVLGTSFDVDQNDDHLTVTVYEGKVEVLAKQQFVLIPPQQAIVKDGNITILDNLPLEQLPLWRTGWLEVKEQPLKQVISKLQRYSDKPINFSEQLSEQLISGRFKLSEPKQSLSLIASSYQWQVNEKLSGLYLTTL